MTYDDWQAVIAPKVDRIRNLHKELAATDLDFCVLFGALSSQIGQIDQVNYAASNTFLDAFVQRRYGLDLPGSVIDIREKQSVLAQLRSLGMQTLQEQDLFDALQLAIVRSLPRTVRSPQDHWQYHSHHRRVGSRLGFSNPAHWPPASCPPRRSEKQSVVEADARMSRCSIIESANLLPDTEISDAGSAVLVSFSHDPCYRYVGMRRAPTSWLAESESNCALSCCWLIARRSLM